jgi:hypothetical protein
VVLGDVLSSVLDPVDGTRVAWLEATDPIRRLTPGLSGRVLVVLGETDAVEVSTSALIVSASGTMVERASEDGQTTRVPVQVLGATTTRAIVRGIALGDRIAVDPIRPASGEGP